MNAHSAIFTIDEDDEPVFFKIPAQTVTCVFLNTHLFAGSLQGKIVPSLVFEDEARARALGNLIMSSNADIVGLCEVQICCVASKTFRFGVALFAV